MTLVSSFAKLLQVFADQMTRPTFDKFKELAAGWIFAPRRNVMAMIRSVAAERHHSVYHRVFSAARWSADQVGLAVLKLILEVARPLSVMLVVDDSFFAHWGPKIFGAGMHRDPVLSSRHKHVLRWGHCWVTLSVVIERPWAQGRYLALPVLARLYLNEKTAAKCRRVYRSKTDLFRDMLRVVCPHVGGRRIHVLGDGLYAAPVVLASLPKDVEMTGRVRLDARLHELPEPKPAHQRGRPRKRGRRLPNPRQMLEAKPLPHVKVELAQRRYEVRLAERVGIFYKAPERPVKVVAVEHVRGRRDQEVFYSTRHQAPALSVLHWYSRRMCGEGMYRDVNQHLGAGQEQCRTRKAVQRMLPSTLWLYSLVTLWHEWMRKEPAAWLRVWKHKAAPSFADMLAALRIDSLRASLMPDCEGAADDRENFCASLSKADAQKYLVQLERLVALNA